MQARFTGEGSDWRHSTTDSGTSTADANALTATSRIAVRNTALIGDLFERVVAKNVNTFRIDNDVHGIQAIERHRDDRVVKRLLQNNSLAIILEGDSDILSLHVARDVPASVIMGDGTRDGYVYWNHWKHLFRKLKIH